MEIAHEQWGCQGSRGGNGGMALLTALTLLFLLSMLGASFVVFATNRLDNTRMEVQGARAREAARAGIYAGLGEIQEALAASRAPQAAYTLRLPVYTLGPASSGVTVRANVCAETAVQITPGPGDGAYTVISMGTCGKTAPDGRPYHSNTVKAQAVIAFTEGRPHIMDWSEAPAGRDDAPAAPASKP